jgi:hypothetical protein
MAHGKKRIEAMSKKRSAKASRMAAGGNGKSKYAEKIARKTGNGKRLPGWMWWYQSEGATERELAAA